MEDPASQSGEGTVDDPPPTGQTTLQDASASESLVESTADSQKRPPPPPSPLTGCYLLIVIGEPHSDRHKEIILQKISKGFLSWDVSECHVSLEKELQSITVQSPEGEEARYGERLIQYATENLVTEILIHPQLNTLHQCMKNLLSSFTKHRHIIHAGYTFAGNGSWILQDGTLSISDLVEALHESDVLRVLKAYENSVTIDIHCAPEGDWTTERFQKEPVSKLCKIRVNPDDVMTAGDPAISAFIDYLSPFLEPANIQQLLQPTDVVGNIRFTHPTLYVFPGGQGDAALFGINGFNMLVDGGFSRKACFWDFARHLDRLDAVLLTRLNNSTVNGISAVLQRKKMNHVYPQIGHFFCNLQDRKIALSPDGDKDKDSLIVNLAEEGQEIVANLKHLALKPHPCYRDGHQVDPVNLYHKVGHGKLDMYVISPARDSQAVKEFLSKWRANDNLLFSNTGKKVGGKGFDFPIQNLVSICALLVWQPANPNDTITRILFPGSTPQHKIFEGLDKLRHLEFLKHPVCSARSISPSASAVTVARSLSKTRQPEDRFKTKPTEAQKPIVDKKKMEIKTKPKPLKQKIDTNKDTEKEESKLDGIKKIEDRMFEKDDKLENITKEIQKIRQESAAQKMETDQNEGEAEKQAKKVVHRSKYDMRNVKSKVDSRAPSKSIDRKKIPDKKTETGTSPPVTPKKALVNGTGAKPEKSRSLSRPSRSSPSATPGKSVKEANNRKVVEARVISRATKAPTKAPPAPSAAAAVPPAPPAPAKTERKPISRRPKAASPAKKPAQSPVRAAKTKPAPAKPEVDSAAKKIKGKVMTDVIKTVTAEVEKAVTDEVNTEAEPMEVAQEAKTDVGGITEAEAEGLTENKETDEGAVKEAQIDKPKESEATIEIEIKEEAHDEEYLVVTKEEEPAKDELKMEEEPVEDEDKKVDQDSLQEDTKTKDETEGENEIKKIHRDEEDSEKKRKMMDLEETEEGSPKSPEVKEEAEEEVQKVSFPEEQEEVVDTKEPVSKEQKEAESLPDEKFSTTVETSATTAPTLPEDEKIEELEKDEKEKEVAELPQTELLPEKLTKEEAKDEEMEDKESRPEQPAPLTKIPTPAMPEETETPQQRLQVRDLVKTPDEVADLPVHEEVDPRMYSSGEYTKDLQAKPDETDAEVEEDTQSVDFMAGDKGEATILDELEKEGPEMKKVEEDMRETEYEGEKGEESAGDITNKYLDIIDHLERSASQETAKEIPEKAPEVIPFVKEEEEEETVPDEKITAAAESLPVESTPAVVQPEPEQASAIEKDAEEEVKEIEKEISTPEPPAQKPESPEKATFQPISIPEDAPSGKSTPEVVVSGKITPETSGKSTPVSGTKSPAIVADAEGPAEEAASLKITDSDKTTQEEVVAEKITPEPSGKSTPVSAPKSPEIMPDAKAIVEETAPKTTDSGKSTPEERGKASPEIEETAEEPSPEKKEATHSEMLIQSEKEWYEKDVSPKRASPVPEEPEVQVQPSATSTPEKEPASSEKPLPKPDLSDKEDEGVPSADSALEKHEILEDSGTSGRVTPEERPETAKDSAETTVDRLSPDEKQLSGQASPVTCETSIASPDIVDSGKTTPHSSEKASPSATPEVPEGVPSGRASPSISGKKTPQVQEETPASGKSTPASLKAQEKDVKMTPVSSGKATPQLGDEGFSGKGTPEVSDKENLPSSDEKEKEASRESTPVDKVSGTGTPELPGKDLSSEGTPISSEKDVSENITSISGKESPVSEKDSLGRVTPDGVALSLNGTPEKKKTPSPEMAEDAKKQPSLPASPRATESPKEMDKPKHLIEGASGKSTPLEAIKSSSATSSLPESPAPSSGIVSPAHSSDRKDESESGRLSISGKNTPLDKVEGSLTNGVAGLEEELEKGTLESETHEKESQLTDDISSGEDEELKALEQGDDGDESEPESITRERLQSLAHGDLGPESATSSPRKKLGSGASSTPVEHISQESAQSSPKGKKDDINNLVKSAADSDNQAAVKRMLVTTSSEDGGVEIEICPQGSIRLIKAEGASKEEKSCEGSDDEKKEDFGTLVSCAREEYNLQRSRKSSVNTPEQDTSEEHDLDDQAAEPGEFGSLIAQAQKEYERQRSRKSSVNSSEPEEGKPEGSALATAAVSGHESGGIEEGSGGTPIPPTVTEEKEGREDASAIQVTAIQGDKIEETVITTEEEVAKGEEELGSRKTSVCSTISQEDLVSGKDSAARIDELRSSSLEMSPLKTTYITSDSGDAETLATSTFYEGEEEVLEYRKEKGYESITQVDPDGEKTEKTYFYSSDAEASMPSGAFLKGIPESIPEAPEMTFETFPTRDSFLPDDFAKAVDEHRTTRGEYLGQPPAGKEDETKDDPEKDVLQGWGKPLGLPLPPKNARNPAVLAGQNISTTSSLSTPSENSDSIGNWGHPMSLPSPAPPPTQNGTAEPKETPKKEAKTIRAKKSDNKGSGTNTPSRRSESPVKQPERRALSAGRNKGSSNSFLYLDLTYVPHHGNSYYSNVEFFKRVRARYYVFSGTEPSKEVYNALLEAKQTWEDKDLEVTIIPTYDTDILGYWVAENEEILAKNKIDLSPSASRCTINLQDHETSCSAYRLEF